MILPVTVYIEVIMALARRNESRDVLGQATKYFLSLPQAQLVEVTYTRMIDVVDTVSSLKLRGMDAIVVAIAYEYESTLATLDQELGRKARLMVKVVDF